MRLVIKYVGFFRLDLLKAYNMAKKWLQMADSLYTHWHALHCSTTKLMLLAHGSASAHNTDAGLRIEERLMDVEKEEGSLVIG